MAASETALHEVAKFGDKPTTADLDRCVHCGLCLNACPTYRVLGVEMDSPRGRVYQMVQVSSGTEEINPDYIEHLDLCLACRACESACPSGVQYGRLIEAARAEIENKTARPWHARLARNLIFQWLLPSRAGLQAAAAMLWFYQRTGLQRLIRNTHFLTGRLADIEALSPAAEFPTFFRQYGKVFPAEGERRYKVALLGGCIANVSFARLNEATVRVLQKNGCEVHVPDGQTCCGALHVHAGMREQARMLARRNIDALIGRGYDAIITNAAGCGSTLKEYDELLEHDAEYRGRAREFRRLMKDINEFLATIELNRAGLSPLPYRVTYQDSCHLAHGQKIRAAPRQLLRAVPGLILREMPNADICCGSAGIYNVVQNAMAMEILERKMASVNLVDPDVIVTANPGCMIQLRAGAMLHGRGQRVAHVVEILDEAYAAAPGNQA
ncbi:MAG TPA: heterodisulfide reductase-related iron-sulfur binding cluster [Bryobacteraceae bacterium]|nr:heterodisulfide reductase-related iron-sulfur binding cluster [Bryobacteraceae bacterium]